MLANTPGERFLTFPYSRLAFMCSFPMALLSLIGVWGVPSQLLINSVVERRNAPIQVITNGPKLPFMIISNAATQSAKADIDVSPQHYRGTKVCSADFADLGRKHSNGCFGAFTGVPAPSGQKITAALICFLYNLHLNSVGGSAPAERFSMIEMCIGRGSPLRV
jgi:hypothetical protein